jgi:class 3 adenylate cyclase
MAGFTAASEQLGEEGAYDLMQAVFAVMAAAVREQGGVVGNFMGDGIMAIFGAPAPLEDAPLRACKASLVIHERLAVAAADIERRHGVRPVLRIGVNTGPVVLGQIESGWESVSGDTVNFASRLQTLAEPGTVLASEATHRMVQGLVQTSFAGVHQVKGKSEPQKVYRIHAIKAGAVRFDAALSRGLTPYVGRERELSGLLACLEDAAAGLLVVDIVADPGMGKSRVLHEFRLRVGEERAAFLTGSCSPDGTTTAFLAFIAVVRSSFSLSAGESETEIARKLDAGLARLGLQSAQHLGLLLNLLGLKAPEGALTGLDGTLIGLHTRGLLHDLLEARCRLSPVVLEIEDLHWIDSASAEFLNTLIQRTDLPGLLIVHTRRPTYQPPWIERACVTTMKLEALAPADVVEIVRARFESRVLPEALTSLAVERADGNALFAEEIASFLIERGGIRVSGDSVEYDTSGIALGIPNSLLSVLAARLENLPVADRSLLQVASVIGRNFDPGLLEAVADPKSDAIKRLAAMRPYDLVHQDANSGDFVFKHALVRDALYNGLLKPSRETLHRRIAYEIERRSDNRLNEVAEELAHHFDAAKEPYKAFQYLTMAARKSLGVYSLDQAAAFFARAVALVSEHSEISVGQPFRAFVVSYILYLQAIYEPARILDAIDKYREAWTAMGDCVEVVIVRQYEVWALFWTDRYTEARQAQQEVAAAAERIGGDTPRAYALFGDFLTDCLECPVSEDIVERGEAAIATAVRTDDPYIITWMRFMVAWNALHRGQVARARAISGDLMKSGEALRDPRATGLGLAIQGWIAVLSDDREAALRIAEETLAKAITPYEIFNGWDVKAVALILLKRVDEGAPILERVRATEAARQLWYQFNGHDPAYGVMLALQGRLTEGVRYLEDRIAKSTRLGYRLHAEWTRIVLAQLYLDVLTSEERPALGLILRNLFFIIRVKASGARTVISLLETTLKYPNFNAEEGFWKGQIYFLMGLAYKHMGKIETARDLFLKGKNIMAQRGDSMVLRRAEQEIAKMQFES